MFFETMGNVLIRRKNEHLICLIVQLRIYTQLNNWTEQNRVADLDSTACPIRSLNKSVDKKTSI